jgi:hypothetical protein
MPASRPTSRRWWLAVALVAACGGPDPTSVRVRVSYEESWNLDGFRIRADDRESSSPVDTTVTLLVPDDWADRTIAVDLWGLRGGQSVAHGAAEATPRRGQQVTIDLSMRRVPCGEWCTPGATRCDGDGVSVCEEREQDGCTEWSATAACSEEAPFCSVGECRATCVDECAAGETRCDGPGGLRQCGQGDSDTCLDWLPTEPCAGEETCSSGACRAECVDECSPGDALCAGNDAVGCDDLDGDGCLEWSPPAPCGGMVCDQGACTAACTDECGDACTGLLYRVCGQYDFDACEDLSPGTSCVPDDPCEEGLCSAAGCDSEPRTCDEPPPAECVDDETLRVYEPVGLCAAGDGCDYDHVDVDCPGCPGCDLCGGMACTTPPEPVCVDDSTLRTYEPAGTCTDGECEYGYTDAPCSNGCSAGACGGVASVEAGGDHTCVVKVGGLLVCWGQNDDGEVTPPSGTFSEVSAGARHTCGRRTDGRLACWGDDSSGQASPPVDGTFVAVSTGTTHSCAIRTDSTLICWGNDSAVGSEPAGAFTAVSSGSNHSCALRSDQFPVCWGSNLDGRVSPGPNPGETFKAVGAGGGHSCGLRTDGTVFCWGNNDDGQTTPPSGTTFSSISVGGFHNCGIRTDGTVACWGLNENGQATPPSGTFLSVNSGARHNCGIRTSGVLACWGDNDFGQSTPPDLDP